MITKFNKIWNKKPRRLVGLGATYRTYIPNHFQAQGQGWTSQQPVIAKKFYSNNNGNNNNDNNTIELFLLIGKIKRLFIKEFNNNNNISNKY